MGRKGMRAFLSEPRFEPVPAVLEGPGIDGGATGLKDIQLTRRLLREGIKARG
jgi:hypothetical protein